MKKMVVPRVGHNVVKEDYSRNVLTEDDKLRLALASGSSYNRRILEDRMKSLQMINEVAYPLTRSPRRSSVRSIQWTT